MTEPQEQMDPIDSIEFPSEVGSDQGKGARQGVEPLAPGAPDGCMTADQFYATFRMIIGAPNAAFILKKQPPLQTLILSEDDQAARAASDEIYNWAAEENSAFRFLISLEGTWMQRAVVIGSFGFNIASGVASEMKARRVSAQQDGGEDESKGGDAKKPDAQPDMSAAQQQEAVYAQAVPDAG